MESRLHRSQANYKEIVEISVFMEIFEISGFIEIFEISGFMEIFIILEVFQFSR